MKKKYSILAVVLAMSAVSSCLKAVDPGSPAESVRMSVTVSVPEEYRSKVDVTEIAVRMQNKTLPISYTKYPDADGRIEFSVAADKYDILASYYDKATRVSANGMCKEFLLTDKGIAVEGGGYRKAEAAIDISVSLPSPIVIRELYYHGSKALEGDKTYTKDRYFEIFNNRGKGGETYYLDSLCVAGLYPYNSTAATNAWNGADTLAIGQMYWMFPGNGKTYPLEPGESVVVAVLAAVDHTTRATSGLQLNKAHFCCYDEQLSGHENSAGVTPLEMTMTGGGTAWALSIHSPAFVIFRPSMGVATYRRHPEIWEMYEPGKTSGTKYWHIAKEWIIDGIECYDSPAGALKRLPASIDASYACMKSPHYSGLCITRKLDEEATVDGIEVYVDTNNSLEDFITDAVPSPRLRQ